VPRRPTREPHVLRARIQSEEARTATNTQHVFGAVGPKLGCRRRPLALDGRSRGTALAGCGTRPLSLLLTSGRRAPLCTALEDLPDNAPEIGAP
jgi:hypothetical protein